MISENPHAFKEDEKAEWEHLVLVLQLIYEHGKGEDSFWKPYLDLMPDVSFFCKWSVEMVEATQDSNLKQYSTTYIEELNREWTLLGEILSKYPDIFPQSSINPELFQKFYAQVCTRCFGWGLPSTAMIPMADNINHSDVTVVQEIFNSEMHPQADRSTAYFTKTKYMNDYSVNYDPETLAGLEGDKLANVKGWFNRANYEANKQFTECAKIKEALKNGV